MFVLVIGAGVIGLATARALAMRGHEVVVAEATAGIGNGISSRNSEVIHAGLYYPTGSLRATYCVEGRRALYAYCESRGVPHRKCGKLIVATQADEEAKIAAILDQGTANGVEGLSLLDGREARALEPNLFCTAALRSSETGIVDTHALMLSLQGDLEDAGGVVAFCTSVERLVPKDGGWRATIGGVDGGEIQVDAFVNAAGLGAQALASRTETYPTDMIPRLVLAKGNYFGCTGRSAFKQLIYPAPVDGGLGTHLTLDLAGRMRFGPDVEWIDIEDYDVHPGRAAAFYASIRRYWPGLEDGSLFADYAGVRPKLTGPGETPADFLIAGPEQHGFAGAVHLFGIESPGLTSSLAIAEEVSNRISSVT